MDQILQFVYIGVGALVAVAAIIILVLRLRYQDDSRLSRYKRSQINTWAWIFGIVLFAAWLALTYFVVVK